MHLALYHHVRVNALLFTCHHTRHLKRVLGHMVIHCRLGGQSTRMIFVANIGDPDRDILSVFPLGNSFIRVHSQLT